MSASPKEMYEFGSFRIDVAERLLLNDGRPISLTPKAFDLLLVLVENSGHLLEKEQLMRRLWPDTFVEDANLSNNISLLRKALGDDSGEHRYIETVPRRGYRFLADVTDQSVESSELIVQKRRRTTLTLVQDDDIDTLHQAHNQATSVSGSERTPTNTTRTILLSVAVALMVIAAGLLAYRLWWKRAAPGGPIRSIAVLPFKPLVAGSRDELLEMGMTETLITRLSRLKEVAVRPVGSVRKYSELQQDPIAAGREQKVDAVVDGNIQTTGGRIRVTARLLRVKDGHTLWADRFDAPFADIFAVEDSISERVVAAMAVRLAGEERQLLTRHYTDNTEAYQLYLKGRVYILQLTEEAVQKALECFDRAIALDPNYALAYAGKADVYSTYSSVFFHPGDAMPKAREAVLKALEIDDQLAEAHRSLALVMLFADWDFAGAERELKRTLEIKPNDAETLSSYCGFLITLKRFDEAFAHSERARELDPVSMRTNYSTYRYLYYGRQYEQALEQCRELSALYPNSPQPHRALGCVLRQKGMYEEAIAELKKATDLLRQDSFLSDLGNTYALAGRTVEAKKLVKELEDLSRRRYVSPVSIARIYAGLGDRDLVLLWLQKAYADRADHLLTVGVDPSFDGVRSDARIADLVRRTGLP
jgi:DNA-binding winged helix-turn-helix (wHTH) protein/TolB-like protein/lipoprotein NlpI